MINTSIIETTIAKKLIEAEPTLDVQGLDKKILQIAYKDLLNFAKFTMKTPNEKQDNDQVIEMVARHLAEKNKEAEDFIGAWVGLWMGKWKQRFKLVLTHPSKSRETTSTKTSTAPITNEIDNKEEMLDLIASNLIKNGEICGTEIIAENILKVELAKNGEKMANSSEDFCNVLNGALRRARETAQTYSPLVFVKVDKGYYKTIRSQQEQVN